MPVPNGPTSKKSVANKHPVPPRESLGAGSSPAAPKVSLPSSRFARRNALLAILDDGSGSMAKFHLRQSEFIPALLRPLLELPGGRKSAERIYVLYVMMSGGVFATPCVPLTTLIDSMPTFELNGHTPVDEALSTIAVSGDAFFTEVYAQEASVVEAQVLLFTDLWPSTADGRPGTCGEGVARFLEFTTKHHVKVTVVAPDAESLNKPLASQLSSPNCPIRYLHDDPDGIVNFTVETLSIVSRKLTGQRPPTAG